MNEKEYVLNIIEMSNNIIACANNLTTGNVSHNKQFLENCVINIKGEAEKLLPIIDKNVFPYNIEIGDTIAYVCNGRADSDRGRLISNVVTEELLKNILKYETTENYHQFRIMKKFNEE